MTYDKAVANIVLFDCDDVVRTSNGGSPGNGCDSTSGSCNGGEWKPGGNNGCAGGHNSSNH